MFGRTRNILLLIVATQFFIGCCPCWGRRSCRVWSGAGCDPCASSYGSPGVMLPGPGPVPPTAMPGPGQPIQPIPTFTTSSTAALHGYGK